MKPFKTAIFIFIIFSAFACKKDKNHPTPQSPVTLGQHAVTVQLSGNGEYTSLISLKKKMCNDSQLTLLDSVDQKGLLYTFKKTISDGGHLILRIQGDSTFKSVYQIIDNDVIMESGTFLINGKSTDGKNSSIILQYPNDAQ